MGKPSGPKPEKVGTIVDGSAGQVAPDVATPPAGEPGRAEIERVQKEQRATDVREESPSAQSERFSSDVRARVASPSVKGVSTSKRNLLPHRLQLAEQAFTRHYVLAEKDTTIEDLLAPSYWSNVAKKLKVGDEITVDNDEGSYRARLVVLERGPFYARVILDGEPLQLQFSEPDVDATIPPGYDIKWMGRHEGYSVIEGNKNLRGGFGSKGEATRWLQNHLRGRAA